MKCSHNELASLIKKAAMGKGFPEGTAKEIAFGALCLPSRQAEVALAGLAEEAGWSVTANGPALFDQAFMALSCEEANEFRQTLIDVNCPELLEGMASAAACNYGLIVNIKVSAETTDISMRLGEAISPPTISGAIDVPPNIYEALNALAQKTYVPATDASRLKGAGAGLTDND